MSPAKNTGNNKKGLTARQKAIIEILTKFSATEPVTISAISEKLKLSSRTILREMPTIENWLCENQFKFIRKPGVGLVLEESHENQKKILQLLDVEPVERLYSKEERRKFLLGELLAIKEPRKSFYFTSKFKISEGTLSNDLDVLEKWLATYHIKIIRKQGLGIYLEATEENRRQAIANVIYDFMEETEIFSLLQKHHTAEDASKTEKNTHNRLLHFLDENIVKTVEQILYQTEQELKIKYADNAYISLVVHISLAIKRIQNLEKIQMQQHKLQTLLLTPEYSVAEEISKKLSKAFHIEIPFDEIGFITMHLLSAKIWFLEDDIQLNARKCTIRQLVKDMIFIVEQELGLPLKENEELYEDLTQHILPVISRLSMNVHIKNTQMQTIKQNYQNIFQATAKACELLKQTANVNTIPETEIAFIAMHFCAAVEKLRSKEKQFLIAVVCPTGIGTSRMLAANLKKSFYNIEIGYSLSALHIDTKKLKEDGIDFIVSTVELNVDYVCACVNPMLIEQDKLLLKNIMKTLEKTKTLKPSAVKNKTKKKITKTEILYITTLGTEIIELLEHVRFFMLQQITDIEDIFSLAGRLFTKEKENAHIVTKALWQRQMQSETYISNLEIMLCHCKTEAVKHCRLGYIGLREPFLYQTSKQKIKGAIVMLIPKTEDISLQVMSEVSSALIQEKELITYLHNFNQNAFTVALEKYLGKYYKRVLQNMYHSKTSF